MAIFRNSQQLLFTQSPRVAAFLSSNQTTNANLPCTRLASSFLNASRTGSTELKPLKFTSCTYGRNVPASAQAAISSSTDDKCGKTIQNSSCFELKKFQPKLRRKMAFAQSIAEFMVGFELLAEKQRDITAESAAARLRDATA
jgi:hypothetical protein